MEPHDLLVRSAGDRAERRILGLGGEQLGLRHERQFGQLLERPDRRIAEPLPVERRSGTDTLDLGRERLLLEMPLLLEREPLLFRIDLVHRRDSDAR